MPGVLFLVLEPPREVIDLYTHASRSSATKTIHSTPTLIPPATQARFRSEIKFRLEPCTIRLIVFFFFSFCQGQNKIRYQQRYKRIRAAFNFRWLAEPVGRLPSGYKFILADAPICTRLTIHFDIL